MIRVTILFTLFLTTHFSYAFLVGVPSKLTSTHELYAMKEATFGMGCFWEPSESMLKVDGVIATKAGYCGAGPNAKVPPSYDSVCYGREWVEAVRIAYDDSILSYKDLLEKFFDSHKANPLSRQYDSIIFADESQMEQAQEWINHGLAVERRRNDGYPISLIKLETISRFWKAEDYHQEYWQKWRGRYALAVLLLAGASGFYDRFLPDSIDILSLSIKIDSMFNALVLTGCAAVVGERVIARNVAELKPGDLITMSSKS